MRDKPSVKGNPELLLMPRADLMLVQARSGRHAEAVAAAGRLEARVADPAELKVPGLTPVRLLQFAACGYALASAHAPDAAAKTPDTAVLTGSSALTMRG